jgi:hypothetical protein
VIWACQLEEAERTFQSVAAFVEAVVSAASAIASAQLNAAVGLVRHEHLAARLDVVRVVAVDTSSGSFLLSDFSSA